MSEFPFASPAAAAAHLGSLEQRGITFECACEPRELRVDGGRLECARCGAPVRDTIAGEAPAPP